MHVLDILICAIIVLSTLISVYRGVVREGLGAASWISASYVTWFFYEPMALILQSYGSSEIVAQILSIGMLFGVVLAIGLWLSVCISTRVQASFWRAVDRAFGLFFGMMRGVLSVCFIYIAWMSVIPMDYSFFMQQSRFSRPIHQMALWLIQKMPRQMRSYAGPVFQDVPFLRQNINEHNHSGENDEALISQNVLLQRKKQQ